MADNPNLKPCPLCGSEVQILDYTDRIYGFCDYMIKCTCGLRFHSKSTQDCFFEGDMIHCPQKSPSEMKLVYNRMIEDWNRRVGE